MEDWEAKKQAEKDKFIEEYKKQRDMLDRIRKENIEKRRRTGQDGKE